MNKTTLAVLAVVIVVLIIGGIYYFGHLGAFAPSNTATSTSATNPSSGTSGGSGTVTTTTTTTTSTGSVSTAGWNTDSDTVGKFLIKYPIDSNITINKTYASSTDWRMNSSGYQGVKALTLVVPASFEPKTNFVDATLTVGYSRDNDAIEKCFTPDPSGGSTVAPSTKTIDGIPFEVFTSNDAGAGNIYQTISYRALQNKTCYAVEYTIHSSQLANYPTSLGITQFDSTKVTNLLNTIVGTFKFL